MSLLNPSDSRPNWPDPEGLRKNLNIPGLLTEKMTVKANESEQKMRVSWPPHPHPPPSAFFERKWAKWSADVSRIQYYLTCLKSWIICWRGPFFTGGWKNGEAPRGAGGGWWLSADLYLFYFIFFLWKSTASCAGYWGAEKISRSNPRKKSDPHFRKQWKCLKLLPQGNITHPSSQNTRSIQNFWRFQRDRLRTEVWEWSPMQCLAGAIERLQLDERPAPQHPVQQAAEAEERKKRERSRGRGRSGEEEKKDWKCRRGCWDAVSTSGSPGAGDGGAQDRSEKFANSYCKFNNNFFSKCARKNEQKSGICVELRNDRFIHK